MTIILCVCSDFCREHEDIILEMLLSVVKLLAQPGSHEILELCELRNCLLLGFSHQYKFLTAKQLKVTSVHNSSYVPSFAQGLGFFGDFGRPSMSVKGTRYLFFWPDEWEREIGRFKSVGHFVKVFINDEWIQGQVVEYVPETDQYVILKDEIVESGDSIGYTAGTSKISVSLNHTKHFWMDHANKDRISKIGTSHLSGTASDEGLFIRIWWSKYRQFFYGRIINYDAKSNRHTVTYEDKDVREYELTNTAKEFEIVFPPEELLRELVSTRPPHEVIAGVAAWHKKHLASLSSGDLPVADEGKEDPSINIRRSILASSSFVPRPSAAEAYQISMHQHAMIHQYFAEGGTDAIFTSLSDQMSSPSCHILWLHLSLIFNLRYFVTSATLKALIWDIKEAIPACMLRFDDSQIKDLNANILADIFHLLKELVNLAMVSASTKDVVSAGVHGNSNPKGNKVHETIDYMKLSVAKMLLTCSQLQKRYLGLSMIKDAVETCVPKIPQFVAKRLHFITGGKAGSRYKQNDPAQMQQQATMSKYVLSGGQMEKWLLSNGIIECLFGDSLHQDLAAKADTLLVFLAHRRGLNEKHLDAVWASAKGAHEAVARVVHNLILLIIPVLDPQLRMYLFQIISSIQNREFTEHILYLIKNYTVHTLLAMKEEAAQQSGNGDGASGATDAFEVSTGLFGDGTQAPVSKPTAAHGGASGGAADAAGSAQGAANRRGQVVSMPQRHWLGFAVLWKFVQDPPADSSEDIVDENLVDLAIQLLVELLEEVGSFKDEREAVMQRCLDNISRGTSVPVSLQILRRTLATYPAPSKSWFSVVGRSSMTKQVTAASQIERLHKQNRLLEVFFGDFARYQHHLSEQCGSEGNQSVASTPSKPNALRPVRSNTEISDLVNDRKLQINGKIGRTSHLRGVVERLEFLKFILSKSSLTMTEQHLMLVWNTLGKGAVTIETLDKLMLWFEGIFAEENRSFSQLLQSLAQEADPLDPLQPSKLAFLVSGSSTTTDTGFQTAPAGAANAGAPTDSLSSFEDNVLVLLFEGSIAAWATAPENITLMSRMSVATFCIKMFLLVNIVNRAIKVEADGSWTRVGQLSGLSVLYRLAVDSSSKVVSDAAMYLIIELHHRMPSKYRTKENIRGHLLRLCFRKLSESIQSLHIGEVPIAKVGEVEESVPPAVGAAQPPTPARGGRVSADQGFSDPDPVHVPTTPSASRQPPNSVAAQNAADDWFDDGEMMFNSKFIARRIARLVLMLRLFIQRYHYEPMCGLKINVLAGRDDAVATTVTVFATDTIATLKQKIGDYFKEPADNIVITRVTKSTGILSGAAGLLSTAEKFDKDAVTIRQAKLVNNDSVHARKKDAAPNKQPNSNEPAPATSIAELEVIKADDIQGSFLEYIAPLTWLGANQQIISTDSDTVGSGKRDKDGFGKVFAVPASPLPVHVDMTMFMEVPTNFSDKGDKQLPTSPMPVTTVEPSSKLIDVLGPFIKTSPQYLDQLLEMLDGYLSTELQGAVGSEFDLSSAVWDVLQSLPTHPALLKQVRGIVSATAEATIRQIFDHNSPYRLLYMLQIVDSLISGDNDLRLNTSATLISKNVLAWILKFFHLGGVDHLLGLVTTVNTLIVSASNEPPASPVYAAGAKKVWGTVSRSDVNVLVASYLSRVLHRLLLFDPLYFCWHPNYVAITPIAKNIVADINAGKPAIPPGLVLSNFRTQEFLAKSFEVIEVVTHSFTSNLVAGSSLNALIENSLLLNFGLITAVDDGYEVLLMLLREAKSAPTAFSASASSSGSTKEEWLTQLFRSVCLQVPNALIRQAACRRIFDASANMWLMCTDTQHSVPQEKKAAKVALFDRIYETVIASAYIDLTVDQPTAAEGRVLQLAHQSEQIYTLFACFQAVQTMPELFIPNQSHTTGVVFNQAHQNRSNTNLQSLDTAVKSSTSDNYLPNHREDSLCMKFMNKLVRHKTSETFHSFKPDPCMVGILRVLLVLASVPAQQSTIGNALLTIEDAGDFTTKDLLTFLYINCLFPNSSSSLLGPRCQTQSSRSLVYALIFLLCKSNEKNYGRLVAIMSNEAHGRNVSASLPSSAMSSPRGRVHYSPDTMGDQRPFVSRSGKPKHKPWNYNPGALVKNSGAYVGLCNQGGTCYMNSLLQQLFHTPAFSSGMLHIEAKPADEVKEPDNEKVLFQLQVLFGFLRLSQKRYYDTLPFCKVFKDYDGEPIRLGEQKDINEFAGMLFDKLESNPDMASLLARTIQGTFVWKTKSIETPYKSDREEKFYMITCDVKNKNTLEDSLELNIAEELFSGDNKLEDTDAGRKVDALRRCAIRKLPPTLIIHLKRFEFDLETMNRKKVNDLITFPMDLNMYPYTEEGIAAKELKLRMRGAAGMEPETPTAPADDVTTGPPTEFNSSKTRDPASPYYQYALKGVVAHMGAIDSGHYYSFIRDKATGKWFEFNDKAVVPFSANDIPLEVRC
jgi:ubiquitin C-terminal hydrolase